MARLADHLVLLEGGRALASGPLSQLLARLDLPTALAEDAGAVIEATVGQHDGRYHLMRLDFGGGAIFVPTREIAIGKRLRLRVHALCGRVFADHALTPRSQHLHPELLLVREQHGLRCGVAAVGL